MQHLEIKHLGKGRSLHIEGYPDASKVTALTGKKAQKLSDLHLHKRDLELALAWLQLLKENEGKESLCQALWRSAVAYFYRCYKGNKARFYHLDENDVLNNDREGLEVFEYFKNLRNKNIIHDDNSIDQCITGAILNKNSSDAKIEKIVTLHFGGESYEDANIDNLILLIKKSLEYIQQEYDKLATEITNDLEKLPYSELAKMPNLEFKKFKTQEIAKSRLGQV